MNLRLERQGAHLSDFDNEHQDQSQRRWPCTVGGKLLVVSAHWGLD